ncbi:DUF3597 domain-containing protein [Croceicoccus marinus]|uniref:DUF3597 domain-containing protein n=1 Tax=Croceicoccus marinus TaxID=450378 RepID=A0A1Z1F8P0_9SPHN|nr:DUF3597 domain-containing protein [Croceicoccus marinus]ARU15150.1 hypothetical protein A9D14_01865 [Croceicoccus marinus]
MGIFSKIRDSIFGKDDDKAKPGAAAGKTAPPRPAPTRPAPTRPAATQAAPAKPAQAKPAPMAEVDVEARLASMGEGKDLNWRSSIVDLMKLLDIDAGYANRKELAAEMGRTDYEGSAEDNIWMHKQVMRELAANGGKVPASLTD